MPDEQDRDLAVGPEAPQQPARRTVLAVGKGRRRYAGVGGGVVNFGGQFAGAVSPFVMGYLAETISYEAAFSFLVVGAAIAILGALVTAQTPEAFQAALGRHVAEARGTAGLTVGQTAGRSQQPAATSTASTARRRTGSIAVGTKCGECTPGARPAVTAASGCSASAA